MRRWLLGVLGMMACAPAAVGPQSVNGVAPAIQGSAASRPESAPATTPVAVTPPTSAPVSIVSPEARARARVAMSQALELWSVGRVAEANELVDLGLSVLGRRLPEDAAPERIGSWLENTSHSADALALAMGDAETILVAESSTGRILGLRVHDYAGSEGEPAVSPKGSWLVAPSGSELLVYESKGLGVRLRIPARKDAPFAFLSEERLVTVRLGQASSVMPAPRMQLLQRQLESGSKGAAIGPRATQSSATQSSATQSSATQSSATQSSATEASSDPEFSDDELVIVDLRTGKTERVLTLAPPPDGGLLRKVASLPPSQRCNESDECQRYELDPTPIGRRVQELRMVAGVIVASWQGGATTLHRIRDGKLLGAFRSRGERWKPGLVAIWPNPPKAAVVTSLPNVGRGHEPPFSVTALFDLNQGRVLEILDECRWATGLAFSRDGARLMIGDMRRACLHDGRNGRYLETTEELRPAQGPGDDLQDVAIRAAPERRWLLTTADGTYGLFDEGAGRALFRGKTNQVSPLVASDERSVFVADFSGGEAQLISFGPSGLQRRLLRAEELEQKRLPPELAESPEGRRAAVLEKVLQQSCLIEGFRLPAELCHRTSKTP